MNEAKEARQLIERLIFQLDNAVRVIHREGGTMHISAADHVLKESRAYVMRHPME